MWVFVQRTSDRGDSSLLEPPCEGAVPVPYSGRYEGFYGDEDVWHFRWALEVHDLYDVWRIASGERIILSRYFQDDIDPEDGSPILTMEFYDDWRE